MFEVRETGRDGRLTHVWFQIETREEAIKIMIKRIFGKDAKVFKSQNEWTGCDIYEVFGNSMRLYQIFNRSITTKNSWYKKGLFDRYECDNTIGPSTEFIYEIWRG